MINLLWLILSYPISHILMDRAMVLDPDMPKNKIRYNRTRIMFYLPGINLIVMLIYLIIMVISFDRDNFNNNE